MANSALTVTSVTNPSLDDKERNKIVLDWLSDDTNGNLSKDIASAYATAQAALSTYHIQPDKLKGYIVGVETIPGENGDLSTDLPTDQYDIELHTPYDTDVMGGTTKDRSGTVAQMEAPSVFIPIDSELTLEISNAGNSKQGRIILHIAPEPKN